MKRSSFTLLFAVVGIYVLTTVAFSQGKGGGGTSACPSPSPQPDTKCYGGSGCLDVSFDADGLVETFINTNEANIIRAVLVQPDGKIVAVGQSDSGSSSTAHDWMVARYNADGTLDTSFGDFDPTTLLRRGYTIFPMVIGAWGGERVEAGALQVDGKIIVGGYSNGSGAVARLNDDGTLDSSFDGDGKLFTPDVGNVTVKDVAVQGDGKIVVGLGASFTVIRLNTDGSRDSTFGTAGKVTTTPSGGTNVSSALWSIALQRIASDPPGEQRIVLAGVGQASKQSRPGFGVMRLRPNGTVDTSFATNGKTVTTFYNQDDQGRRVAIDPSNKIVVSGLVRTSSCFNDQDFGVARYTENGVLDASFSGDGKASTNVYNGNNSPYALAVAADGKVLVGGTSSYYVGPINNQDFTVIRYNADGSQDSTFGPGIHGAGVVTLHFDGYKGNFQYTLTVQPNDGWIIAGGVSSMGNSNGRLAMARYLP